VAGHAGRARLGLVALALVGSLACAGAPRAERTLRIGTTVDEYVTTRDASRLAMYPLNTNVAEPLVRLTPDYRVVPALAERWEYRGDNTWRFHLRRGVTFHDGQPLKADAVRWSFDRVARSETGTSFMSEGSTVVVDDLTVDVTPTRPNMRLVEQLVHPTYAIVAPGTEPGDAVVATGPFRVAEYRRGEFIRVTRFDGYWGPRPALEAMHFRFFPDATSRVLALLAGEVDLVTDVPREQAATLAAASGVQVTRTPLGQVLLLYLNRHGRAPFTTFSDPAVRHAFAVAIDRQALVSQVWKGEGAVVPGMAPPSILGDSAALVAGFVTAPDRAAALLDGAGWRRGPGGVRMKAGRPLTVVILSRREASMGTGEFLQAQLRSLGMQVTVDDQPDLPSYQVRLRSGEFDGALEAPNQNDANPVFLPALRLSATSANRTSRWFLLDAPFEAAVASALGSPTIADAQRSAAEAMHLAIDEQATVVPLAGLRRIFAASGRVRGLVPHPSFTSQSWHEITLEETIRP
jgi:peptide/nickel transport system substrate-binding protein